MFNLFNANTVMGQRANQNAANANQVFGILAPRIARVGRDADVLSRLASRFNIGPP